MKRITNRKFRLKYFLRVTKKDGSIKRYFKLIKSKIVSTIQELSAIECVKYFIKVEYKNGVYNSGEYETKKDLLFALDQFTEKNTLDYAEKY